MSILATFQSAVAEGGKEKSKPQKQPPEVFF